MKTYTPESLETNVSDLILESPHLTGLFEKHKIEFCCKGNVPLKISLKELNIPEKDFLVKMNESAKLRDPGANYPNTSDPIQIISYVVEVYHRPLPTMLDELNALIQRAVGRHGEHRNFINIVNQNFLKLAGEFSRHIEEEETKVFPMIQEAYLAKIKNKPQPKFNGVTVGEMIDKMESEHHVVGDLLDTIDDAIKPENLTVTGCMTLRTIENLFNHLRLETHKHIHMENYLLHPIARTL